ncbi:hypothetical protein [Bradyrhizobium frederickii]|uniref:hypothetical protein n=1 Tax=Bradyrhizobium frederickii TaxID=2560054 RepID=UPI001ADDD21B|nr:hypothetical protein [Bradyrhizobium frederickii]
MTECSSRSDPLLGHFVENIGPLGTQGKPEEGLIAPREVKHARDLGEAERHVSRRMAEKVIVERVDRGRGLHPVGKAARQSLLLQRSRLHEGVVVPQHADPQHRSRSEQEREGNARADPMVCQTLEREQRQRRRNTEQQQVTALVKMRGRGSQASDQIG